MDPKQFAVAAAIRAVKTFAQTMLALIGTDLLGLTDVDWGALASVALVAAILSVLTSIASMPFGEKGTPGLPGEDIAEPEFVEVSVITNPSGTIPEQRPEPVEGEGPVDGEAESPADGEA